MLANGERVVRTDGQNIKSSNKQKNIANYQSTLILKARIGKHFNLSIVF